MGRSWIDDGERPRLRDRKVFGSFLGWLANRRQVTDENIDLKPEYVSIENEIEFFDSNAVGINKQVTALLKQVVGLDKDFVDLDFSTLSSDPTKVKSWIIGSKFSNTGIPQTRDNRALLSTNDIEPRSPIKIDLLGDGFEAQDFRVVSMFSNVTGKVSSVVYVNENHELNPMFKRKNARIQGNQAQFVVDSGGFVTVFRDYYEGSDYRFAIDFDVDQNTAQVGLATLLACLDQNVSQLSEFELIINNTWDRL